MSWARIDDAFDDHPKVLALLEYDQGAAAIGLWTLCLTWAHRNTRRRGKVPGLLPVSLPRRYLGPGARELAELLVTEKLWEDRGPDGWMIHDFERYLPTEQTRDARAEAGRKGAEARWGKRAGRDGNLPPKDGKVMAADGNDGARGADEGTEDPDGGQHPSMDGKEPNGDSNLPSGLLFTDGKPMAGDGSRAPARRAISNEIAPTPAPEPKESEPPLAGGVEGGDSAKPAKRTRGSRIPDDFRVTPEMVEWTRHRCPHVNGRLETEKFRNHFQAKAGREALKVDWDKTWMNWMLTAEQQASRVPSGQSPAPPDHRREWERNRS